MNFATDKKYIISLERRLDRRAHILWQMQKFGFENYQVVDAVDGERVTHTSRPTRHMPDGLSKYQIACLRSHLAVILDAKSKNLPHATIIEDDCIFTEDFTERYYGCKMQLPGFWQMFYLGANHVKQPSLISDNIAVCKCALTTVCYVVKKEIYDIIIDAILKEDMTLDLIYVEHVHPKIAALSAYPNLVSQINGFSDVEQKEVNYSKYYKCPS